MKKIITLLSITLAFNTTVVVAQDKTAAKPAAKTPAKAKLTAKDSMMCREWHIVAVEEWGVVAKPPAERNKKDMVKMNLDGTYNMVMFGNPKAGTWSRSGQNIFYTDDATKTKFFYKILILEPNKLKVDHYSVADDHSMFEFEPK